MWQFLYRILCILIRCERISTRKIKKIPFSGHYGLKTDISAQAGDHWLQAHTRNQRNSASDSHNT